MSNVSFTSEELEQIRKLQEKYNVLGIQLVQLKLAQKNAQKYVDNLKEQENTVESQIVLVNDEEKALAKQLDEKYGAGSLDLESGVFTPKK